MCLLPPGANEIISGESGDCRRQLETSHLGLVVPGCRTMIAVMAALVLLPIGVSKAGWLSDIFRGSPKLSKSRPHVASSKHAASAKRATSTKRAASPKPHNVKLAALGAANSNPSGPKPVASLCDPAKFRIVVDVGHTAESEGAISSRKVPEFVFNLRLARQIEEKLKAEGFAETRLLVTEGKARPSLAKRVAAANNLHANLFLSIHHDSVPELDARELGIRGQEKPFQRPLQRLLRLRLPQQPGFQDEPLHSPN